MIVDPGDLSQASAALQALRLRAWSHATTIRLAKVTDGKESAFNTASGVLLQFGQRYVVATAWHVLEKYSHLRQDGQEVYLICDNVPFLEPRTAWRDPPNDIALLDVAAASHLGLEAVPYRVGPLIWPPPQVKPHDSVLICGFPKLMRRDAEEILHGSLNLLVDVTRVGETYFMLQIELDRLLNAGTVKIPEATTDFGGVSGAPVFLVDNGANPLVGLVSESGENLPLWRIAALNCAPADLSQPGTPL